MDNLFEIRELQWSFDDQGPVVVVGGAKYPFHIKVDPTPCYPHDLILIETTLSFCMSAFPLFIPPLVYNVSFDSTSRTNGQTRSTYDWDRKNEYGQSVQTAVITLYAKRTPIHPALTRYLVAHEYGHAVEIGIAQKLYKSNDTTTELRKEYGKLRGLPDRKHYGPGSWHMDAAEVFANDFRLLVCGIEREFWAHDVCKPQDDPKVVEWWDMARKLDLTPGKPPTEEKKS